MTEAKHTPGPWSLLSGWPTEVVRASEANKGLGGSIHENDDREMFATVIAKAQHNKYSGFAHEIPENEARANARLIAAAPDMLAALKLADANSKDPRDEPWRMMVSAALTKATGAA